MGKSDEGRLRSTGDTVYSGMEVSCGGRFAHLVSSRQTGASVISIPSSSRYLREVEPKPTVNRFGDGSRTRRGYGLPDSRIAREPGDTAGGARSLRCHHRRVRLSGEGGALPGNGHSLNRAIDVGRAER